MEDSLIMIALNHSLINRATIVQHICASIEAMSTLADRIIEAMDKSGVSVKQVAAACEVSYQAVRKWRTAETKKLEAGNLVRLAALTGFEPRWILTGEGPRVRYYARTEAQAHTLKVMETMSEDDQTKIPEIASLLGKHPKKEGNGWQ
jgi:transcriptional regulator with XRE-family HTH domain